MTSSDYPGCDGQGGNKMSSGIIASFPLTWPLLTDAILLGAGALFVVRLYLIERRFEEGLALLEKVQSQKKSGGYTPAADEEWFLAREYAATTPATCRRWRALRNIARLGLFLVSTIVALFGAGTLFAATSTGSISVSA